MKVSPLFVCSATIMSVALSIPASATPYVIRADGTGDFPTIQTAIDDPGVVAGDELVLADGTFVGNGNRDIHYRGKAITIRSQNGPGVCIIDCQGVGLRGFVFQNGEGPGSVLESVTITGGFIDLDNGAAILIESASPTIRDCFITSNVIDEAGSGGGIACMAGSSPRIEQCTLSGNRAGRRFSGDGGGIFADGSSNPTIEGCVVFDNSAANPGGGSGGGIACSAGTITNCDIINNSAGSGGGGIFCGASTVSGSRIHLNSARVGAGVNISGGTLTNCEIIGNAATGLGQGGGVDAVDSTIESCIITGNRSGDPGGGIVAWRSAIRYTTIAANFSESVGGGLAGGDNIVENTIVWGNCADDRADQIFSTSSTTLACSCVDPAQVVGPVVFIGPQVFADPLFCGAEPCESAPTNEGDYTLAVDSPCLPANNECFDTIGALDEGCTPVPTTHVTWGKVKLAFH